jgi:flagellin-specific chaperone FliS
MAPVDLHDALLDALCRAQTAQAMGADDARREALSSAFEALVELYATLDHARRPEVSAHLHALYDRCIERIEGARHGDFKGLDEAVRMLRPVRDAMTYGRRRSAA